MASSWESTRGKSRPVTFNMYDGFHIAAEIRWMNCSGRTNMNRVLVPNSIDEVKRDEIVYIYTSLFIHWYIYLRYLSTPVK